MIIKIIRIMIIDFDSTLCHGSSALIFRLNHFFRCFIWSKIIPVEAC